MTLTVLFIKLTYLTTIWTSQVFHNFLRYSYGVLVQHSASCEKQNSTIVVSYCLRKELNNKTYLWHCHHHRHPPPKWRKNDSSVFLSIFSKEHHEFSALPCSCSPSYHTFEWSLGGSWISITTSESISIVSISFCLILSGVGLVSLSCLVSLGQTRHRPYLRCFLPLSIAFCHCFM